MQKKLKMPQNEENLGEVWEVALFLSDYGQSWLSISAAAEAPRRRTEAVTRMQQEVRTKESRWTEETAKKVQQPKGKDIMEMKKEARRARCTLLNGSAWSTEKRI